ncbi:MAG: hypothetical protein IKP95_03975 [Ruminococcus sp.]|nr:hypothetical protein [Ruminococcus sp.]
MQTIIIKLDSARLRNPDLDIISYLPVRAEEYTDNAVSDNGFDYLSDDVIAVWLETEDAAANAKKVIELMKSERFCDNDLSESAEVYISEEDCAEIENCERVYP